MSPTTHVGNALLRIINILQIPRVSTAVKIGRSGEFSTLSCLGSKKEKIDERTLHSLAQCVMSSRVFEWE
jgi:hypothetical protein